MCSWKSSCKRKFKVYPSAYANAYGVKVCKGQVKSGGKRKTAKGYTRERDELKDGLREVGGRKNW